jgi:hypothetical protein
MLKKLDKILALLPFNGDKLKLSGLFLLVAQIPQLLPGLDLKLLVSMILENPTKAGVVAALVAVLHKIVKAQLPDSQR